ncbi:Uncharacterised protein [Legionella pneumophila]|nr:Uncharacterised protein [Legionella pneumophila]
MRDYWASAVGVSCYSESVSVVGFLDEGLLEKSLNASYTLIVVSVVGFLDEGLLGELTC